MAANCRFAFAVHVLAVLAYKPETDVSSDMLAASVNTNPVIIRRLLLDLRRGGLITTRRGAGGGARLSRPPGAITFGDIYRSVEECRTFSPHPHRPDPHCPVGCQIERVLEEVFASAQTALEQALARHTLAEVLARVTKESPGVRRSPRPRFRPHPDSLPHPTR